MDFANFIRLAEQNQTKNDRKVAQISNEIKRKREFLKNQSNMHCKLDFIRKQDVSDVPVSKTITPLVNCANATVLSDKNLKSDEVNNISKVPKQKRPLSSLMDVLKEMHTKNEETANPYDEASNSTSKIPKIPKRITVEPITTRNPPVYPNSTHDVLDRRKKAQNFKINSSNPSNKTKSNNVSNSLQNSTKMSCLETSQYPSNAYTCKNKVSEKNIRPNTYTNSKSCLPKPFQSVNISDAQFKESTSVTTKLNLNLSKRKSNESKTQVTEKNNIALSNKTYRPVSHSSNPNTSRRDPISLNQNAFHCEPNIYSGDSQPKISGIASQFGVKSLTTLNQKNKVNKWKGNSVKPLISQKTSGIAAQLSTISSEPDTNFTCKVVKPDHHANLHNQLLISKNNKHNNLYKEQPKSCKNSNQSLCSAVAHSSNKKLNNSNKGKLENHTIDKKSSIQHPTFRGIAAQFGGPKFGIAAQYGSVAYNRSRSPSYEEDKYASDDSFIDDSETTTIHEYSKIVQDIHSTLKFDPKKYASVSQFDDLSTMESNYRQIEKEEKTSARLAAKEDEADILAEEERRKRRMEKLKGFLKK